MLADGNLAAQLFLDVAGGGKVVGVDVGFKNPLNLQLFLLHKGNDGVGRRSGRAA